MSKSIATQIAAIEARITKLTAHRDALTAKQNANTVLPAVGDTITFNYGRKDKKVLTGTVLGITLPTEGKPGAPIIKALAGSGLETQVVSLYVTDIIVPQAAEVDQTEPLAE